MNSSRILPIALAGLFVAALLSSALVATSLGVGGPEAWRRGLLAGLLLAGWLATWKRPATASAPLLVAAGLIVLALLSLGRVTDTGLAAARIGDLVILAVSLALAARLTPSERCRFLLAALLGTSLASLLTLVATPWPLIDAGGGLLATRNLSATLAAIGLPFAAYLAIARAHPDRKLAILATLPALAYIALCGNRLAPIAAAAGMAAAAFAQLSLKRRIATVAAVILVIATAAPRTTSVTVTERQGLFEATANEIQHAPLFGVGAGAWPVDFPRAAAATGINTTIAQHAARRPAHAHSDPLEWTAELGPLALIALGLLLALGLRPLLARKPREPHPRAATAALLALAILSLAAFPLSQPEVLAFVGILFAESQPRRARAWAFPRAAPPFAALAVLAFSAIDIAARFDVKEARRLTAGPTPNFQAATPLAMRARARAPWNFAADRLAAWTLSVQGRPAKAAEAAEAALAKRPGHPGALNDLALCKRALGHTQEAEALLRAALAHAPGDPEIALNLADLRATSPGGQDEAVALFQSAVRTNPNLTTAWSGLAELAQIRGEFGASIAYHQAARNAQLRNRIYLKNAR